MSNTQNTAVMRLIEWYENHAKDKGTSDESLKSACQALYTEVLSSIGMDKHALILALHIDRTTLSRWMSLAFIPNANHLNALLRLEKKQLSQSMGTIKKMSPLSFLSTFPRTLGKLRLMVEIYDFNTAIYAFKEPKPKLHFMLSAQQVLRGGTILFLMPKDKIENFRNEFQESTKRVLGKTLSYRVFSRIGIVEVKSSLFGDGSSYANSSSEASIGEGVALFEIEATSRNRAVGYSWVGGKNKEDKPNKFSIDVYEPFGFECERFAFVKEECGEQITDALNTLDQHSVEEIWADVPFSTLELTKEIKVFSLKNK